MTQNESIALIYALARKAMEDSKKTKNRHQKDSGNHRKEFYRQLIYFKNKFISMELNARAFLCDNQSCLKIRYNYASHSEANAKSSTHSLCQDYRHF